MAVEVVLDREGQQVRHGPFPVGHGLLRLAPRVRGFWWHVPSIYGTPFRTRAGVVANLPSIMSIRVWKDVLYPGRQRDKHGTWFTVSRRSTQAAARNCKRMIARGIRVPCVWEHQPGADPVEMSFADTLAHNVKHCFGEIRGAKVDPKGVLWLLHEVYNPADAELLREKRMQVSPKLYPGFEDSRGGEYRGPVVGHVAATPNPVQFWQKPFELSQGNTLLLSYGDRPMADEKDAPEDEVPPEVEQVEPDGDELPENPADEMKGVAAVIEALRESGFNIPDEVQDWEHLVIAIKAAGKNGMDALDAGGGAAPTQTGPSPPMMMSDARTLAAEQRRTKKDLATDVRLHTSTGRCTPAEARKILREIEAVEMSFFRDGRLVPNEVALRVKLIGERPAWSAWKPDGKTDVALELSTTAVPHPAELTSGGPTQTEADVVEETKRRARAYNPAPAK